MPVTLQNRRRQMQVFNLDHRSYCEPSGCGCVELVVTLVREHPRTGAQLPRRIEKKAPGSLTLLALETRRGLPEAILKVPEVKAAIDAGTVRVVEHTSDAPSGPGGGQQAGAAAAQAVVAPAGAGQATTVAGKEAATSPVAPAPAAPAPKPMPPAAPGTGGAK
jgi:hypothetical protein